LITDICTIFDSQRPKAFHFIAIEVPLKARKKNVRELVNGASASTYAARYRLYSRSPTRYPRRTNAASFIATSKPAP